MEIIIGDLIDVALEGRLDIVAQGCNCQNKQKSGVAKKMAEVFRTDSFRLEQPRFKGDMMKLGDIDGERRLVANGKKEITVYNCYTQYYYGRNHEDGVEKPIDYNALTLCMKKLNHLYKGKNLTLGLPYIIGCGLAGGDEERVLKILEEELTDLNVILVKLEKS